MAWNAPAELFSTPEDIRYNSDGRSIRYSALALGQPGTLSEDVLLTGYT